MKQKVIQALHSIFLPRYDYEESLSFIQRTSIYFYAHAWATVIRSWDEPDVPGLNRSWECLFYNTVYTRTSRKVLKS